MVNNTRASPEKVRCKTLGRLIEALAASKLPVPAVIKYKEKVVHTTRIYAVTRINSMISLAVGDEEMIKETINLTPGSFRSVTLN